MKLVEIDENNFSSYSNNAAQIDDDSYSKPRVMPTLDSAMNEILRAPISDGDKWKLYSQTLQRYLNHAKFTARKIDTNYSYLDKAENKNDSIPPSQPENTFDISFDGVSPTSLFNMSGISNIRDSIDGISQPSVRNFFEKAREINTIPTITPSKIDKVNVPDSHQSKKKSKKQAPNRRFLPYRSSAGVAARKRRAENSLAADMSQIRPCKINLNRIQWQPTAAR